MEPVAKTEAEVLAMWLSSLKANVVTDNRYTTKTISDRKNVHKQVAIYLKMYKGLGEKKMIR